MTLRQKITWMWDELEFDHYTKGTPNQLYWHWSPNNGWAMNFELRGWNETLITYILGASSNTISDFERTLYQMLGREFSF